jgi:hypothetical protein
MRARTATAFFPDQEGRPENLELLHIFRQVPACHALVDVFETGQRIKSLDARLHIVPGLFFPRMDRLEVDLVDHPIVGINRLRRDIQAVVALGAHEGNPELPLQAHFSNGRPDGLHIRGGIALGQNIGDRFHEREKGII